MDRPDYGTAEEAEAWEWLKERGLDTYAIFDDLDVCLWVPRFKTISVKIGELGKGTHFYFQFYRMIYNYRNCFAWTPADIGYTTAGNFDIKVKPG